MLYHNSHGEILSRESLEHIISSSSDFIKLCFGEGKSTSVPKFVFQFFSSYNDVDFDIIIVPDLIIEDTSSLQDLFSFRRCDLEDNPTFQTLTKLLGLDLETQETNEDGQFLPELEIKFYSDEMSQKDNHNVTQDEATEQDEEEPVVPEKESKILKSNSQTYEPSSFEWSVDTTGKKVLNIKTLKTEPSEEENEVEEDREKVEEEIEPNNEQSDMKSPAKSFSGRKFKGCKSSFNPQLFGNPKMEWDIDTNGKKILSITCLICGKYFKPDKPVETRKNYKKHYQKHEMELRNCDCGIKFSGIAQKSFHMSTVHDGYFGCTKDLQIFKTSEQLENHEKTHEQVFSCEFCPYKITNHQRDVKYARYNLKKHIEKRHSRPNLEKPNQIFKCSLCAKEDVVREYPSLGLYNHHMKHFHRPSACTICGVVVKMLGRHMDVHKKDEEKRYNCEECGKGFSLKCVLKNHITNQHSGRLLTCRYEGCERAYKDPGNRGAHEKKRHGGLFTRRNAAEI